MGHFEPLCCWNFVHWTEMEYKFDCTCLATVMILQEIEPVVARENSGWWLCGSQNVLLRIPVW